MKNYYQFSQAKFEYELKGILIKNKYGFMQDVTEKWLERGRETWERIYMISTKNPSVKILVFSSIDIKTGKVRDIGNDSVKFVMTWKTKKGVVYKKMAHHYRIKTLFENVEKTLTQSQDQVFNLNYKEFSEAI